MAEYSKDDGMEGGADPCGSQGGGPDVRTGYYDGDADEGPGSVTGTVNPGGDRDFAGSPGGGGDVVPPAGSGTGGQPRPEEWIK
jgi:hypothetical protein